MFLLRRRELAQPFRRLIRVFLPFGAGLVIFWVILLGLPSPTPRALAAPLPRPLAATTVVVTHTTATTHEMSVYGDGRITRQFKTDDGSADGRNLIDQNFDDPLATTLAVLFNQHSVTDVLDVGVQNDFIPLQSITLNTPSSFPGYNEDTLAVYASRVLSYQITQRTLASYNDNCVVMELDILNTGSQNLTDGKLLYMVDIDVAHSSTGDLGFYIPDRRLVYLRDENSASSIKGFAMGVSLIEGEWWGYDVDGFSYPTDRADLKTAMLTPTNIIDDGPNDVLWIVANLPDLEPDETTPLAFALCAQNKPTEQEAGEVIEETFNHLANLSVVKAAIPAAGSTVTAVEPLGYTIALSNTGSRYVSNIVITDTIPAGTELLNFNVTQGTITAANGLVTATIGRLDPTSGTVTMTLVVKPVMTITDGTLLSNQAFVRSEPVITQSNVVTHWVTNRPVLTVDKRVYPSGPVSPGQVLTYTVVVANEGQGYAIGVKIDDPLPVNTGYISDSLVLLPAGAGLQGDGPPLLASGLVISPGDAVTVSWAVTVTDQLVSDTVITNTASVTAPQIPALLTDSVTTTVFVIPSVQVVKTGPAAANVGQTVVFTFTVTNPGGMPVRVTAVEDDLAGPGNLVSGDVNEDGWLDLTETWLYTASYVVPPTAPPILINTVVVTAENFLVTRTATATHSTDISGYAPVLFVDKKGPLTTTVGAAIDYQFWVINVTPAAVVMFNLQGLGIASFGDGSPIRITSVVDDITGEASYTSGDFNKNGLLDGGEGWLYTTSYTVSEADPDSLINTVMAMGLDPDEEMLNATDSHTTTLTRSYEFYFPIILKE